MTLNPSNLNLERDQCLETSSENWHGDKKLDLSRKPTLKETQRKVVILKY